MPYSHMTLGQFKAELLDRLDDSGAVFWTNAGAFNELNLVVQETFYTWQAFSGYWRQRGVFNTVPSQQSYDLPTMLPALLGYNLNDQTLVAKIQADLLEPVTGVSWTGTEQFNLADVTAALERRRNQFLVETGAVITPSTINLVVPPPIGRVPLSDNIIDVRRIAWRAALPSTDVIPLFAQDEWGFSSFDPGWNVNAATPQAYSVIAPPPLQVQLAPVPLASGTLDLLTVNTGSTLDPTVGVLLGIPDNFAWVIKWGALADLLSKEWPSKDAQRAQYAQQRWEEGVEITRIYATIIQGLINDQPVFVQSIQELDTYNPSWGVGTGRPQAIGSAGLNLIGLGAVPDAGPYSITLDVLRNANVPTLDADKLQVGREELDTLLDYSQHLAMFKCGGQEFAETLPLYAKFVRQASIYNDRLRSTATYLRAIQEQSQKEAKVRPRRETDVEVTP